MLVLWKKNKILMQSLMIVLCTHSTSAQPILKKASYKRIRSHNNISQERASLNLYFSHNPTVTEEKKETTDQHDVYQFIFNGIHADKRHVKSLAKKLEAQKDAPFHIAVEQKKDSFHVIVSVNHHDIAVHSELCDAITREKCFSIRLFDKKSLRSQNHPPIHIV